MSLQLGSLFYAFLFSVGANLIARFLVKDDAPEYSLTHPFALFIGLITVAYFYFLFGAVQHLTVRSQSAYVIFSLALSITAQTDAQTLLISRWTTIYLVPVALIYANLGYLTITPLLSISGALLGLLILGITAKLAKKYTGQDSLGQGDIDLLASIGAFLGPIGCWMTLLLGSLSGSFIGLSLLLIKGKSARFMKLPFGTFLAVGALAQLLMELYGISLLTLG